MKRSLPVAAMVTIAAVFSGYHVVLGLWALSRGMLPHPTLAVAAMVVYVAATALALAPWSLALMPTWMAATNTAVAVALPLLVTHDLPAPTEPGGNYSTWHVAAAGTLMAISSARGRHFWGWAGVIALAAQTVLWGGIDAVPVTGVIGSFVLVAIAHSITLRIGRARKEAGRFARTERRASDWRASRDAVLFERQARLGTTSALAEPMLARIAASGGDLSEADRAECLLLEAALRDEVRGRRLLNDRVRAEVMRKRRNGVTVSLFDEGGIDDLNGPARDEVLDALAAAIASAEGDQLVARTVAGDSATAITVVGLHSRDAHDAASEDELALWLEIPRPVS